MSGAIRGSISPERLETGAAGRGIRRGQGCINASPRATGPFTLSLSKFADFDDFPRLDFLESPEFLKVNTLQEQQRLHRIGREPLATATFVDDQAIQEGFTLGRTPQRHDALMNPRKFHLHRRNRLIEPLLFGLLGLSPVDDREFLHHLAQFPADFGVIEAFPTILDFFVREFDRYRPPSDRRYFERHR